MSDPVNHPPHYRSHPSGVECIQITEHMNFCLGNAMKYLWRADLKNDAIEDLEKAAWYIQREIARRKGAPAWAAQAASADHKISPAPTRSPMNSIAPVPTQTVSADAIPAPLTSFEDTTHAWEEGYRAGQSEVGNPTVGDLISQEAAKARKVFSGTCSAAKEAIDYLEQLLLAGRAEGKALVSSWRFRANVAEQQLFDRWRQSLAESGADAPSGDLISREAVLKIFQPETSILRKRICDDIRALPAAPIGKEIW